MGQDEKGEYLSPEERKFRFKKGNDGAALVTKFCKARLSVIITHYTCFSIFILGKIH